MKDPDQINSAIAESLGWIPHLLSNGEKMNPPRWIPCGGNGEFSHTQKTMPNYHGSLDAIVPVVRALDSDDIETVIEWLMDITKGFCALATPAEWCEAYLQWKGLWK